MLTGSSIAPCKEAARRLLPRGARPGPEGCRRVRGGYLHRAVSDIASLRARGGLRSGDCRLGGPLRRRLGGRMRALDRSECAAVEVVEVAARLHLAGVVHEGSLIGQVDPD